MTAIAFIFPHVGYVQGMNFIGSVILSITENDEAEAFLIFTHFLGDSELRMENLFLPGLPELQVMNSSFDKFISKYAPKTASHLRDLDMQTEYFTFKWSMTLFSCFLPIEILPPIFTLFLVQGWASVYRIGISLLNNFLHHKIAGMDSMVEVSQFFRDDVRT